MNDERSDPLADLQRPGRAFPLLILVCALLLVLDLFVERHPHFGILDWPESHAFFGFAAAAVLVVASRIVRALVARPEDYWDG